MRQRPVSTLIFGILNIVWALTKLGGVALALAMSHMKGPTSAAMDALKSDPSYVDLMRFHSGAQLTLGAALLAFSIGLLLLQNWSRLGLIIFSVVDIVFVVVIGMLMWPYTKQVLEHIPNPRPELVQGFAMFALILQITFEVGYAILLLFFMTRTNVIEACQPEPSVPMPPTATV